MKFSEQFFSDEDQMVDGDVIQSVSVEGKCCVCSSMTRWVSLSFLGYYCSSECLESDWNKYWVLSAGEEPNGF